MISFPEISQQEFCDHIEDEDFFLTYGNPVIINAHSGTRLLCIAFPMVERLMRAAGRGEEVEEIKRAAEQKSNA